MKNFKQIRESSLDYSPGAKSIHDEVKEPTGSLKGACWKGYTAVGTKQKNGKTVPNCVPKESAIDSPPAVDAQQRPVGKGWGEQKIEEIFFPVIPATVLQKIASQGHKTEPSHEPAKHPEMHRGCTIKGKEHMDHCAIYGVEKDHYIVHHQTHGKLYRVPKSQVKIHEEYGAGFEGTPELTKKFKDETPGQKEVDEAHSERLEDPFSTKHGTDEKSQKKHAAAMMKMHGVKTHYHPHEGEMSYSGKKANVAAAVKTHNFEESVNEVSGAGEFGIPVTPGASMNIEETKPEHHEKMATYHHDLAHKALKSGDMDKYQHHLDQKYSHSVKRDQLNAKKTPKIYENVDEVDESNIGHEKLNLRITKHEQAAIEAERKGDKHSQQYHLAIANRLKSAKAIGNYMKNEEVENQDDSDLDDQELKRLTILIRLGLMDMQKLTLVKRAIRKLDSDMPVTNIAEKQVLFELLQNLIGLVTGDNAVFNKIRFNVAQHR